MDEHIYRMRTIKALETLASPASDTPDPVPERLDRIKTLTQTARATWFGYLGALAFAGVTVLSVSDVDFFSADATTQLPVVNIAVPVTYFFWAGALLITIVYGYLHVFLEQIWHDLGALPAQYKSEPVATHVHPWLITELALNLRRFIRRRERTTPCSRATPLGILGIGVSFLLGWAAGPILVWYFWLRSMPAHDMWLTGAIGVMFWLTILAMCASLWSMFRNMA